MKRILLGLLVPAILVAIAVPAAAKGDVVKQKDGRWLVSQPTADRPLREDYDDSIINVLEENYDKLVYSVKLGASRTQRQEVDASKVEEVFYWPQPQGWSDAVEAMNSGDFATALAGLTELTKDRRSRRWLRTYSLYNIAQIYEYTGDWKAAIQAWEKLVTDYKKSKFVPKAYIQIGLGHLNLGDAAAARSAFGKLGRIPGLPAGQKVLGKYYLILIKQKQGEGNPPKISPNPVLLKQALAEYRKLLAETENDDELKDVANRARLGVGTCLVQLGQYAEALAFFEKIAASTDDKAVLGGAFNGLGLCYYKQNKWGDALLAFLRTEVLYGEEDPEQEAMALFYSGRCFHLLYGQSVGGDAYKARARSQFKKCMQKYQGTSWSRQSEEGYNSIR